MMDTRGLITLIKDGKSKDILSQFDENPMLVDHVFSDYRGDEVNALYFAVCANRPEIVSGLLKRGAKPLAWSTISDNLIGCLLSNLKYSIKHDVAMLDLLLDTGVPIPVNASDGYGDFITLLRRNVFARDYLEFMECMVARGLDCIHLEDICEKSMIAKALHYQSSETGSIAAFLLELGCRVVPFASENESALERALYYRHYELADKLLLAGATLSENESITSILATLDDVPVNLLDRLLEGVDLAAAPADAEEFTPLEQAIYFDNVRYLSCFTSRGVDIESKTERGTALFFAVSNQRKACIDHLVACGADVNAANNQNETVLDIALAKPGSKLLCAMLKAAGAKTGAEIFLAGDVNAQVVQDIVNAINPGEVWADEARSYLKNLPSDQAMAWVRILRHCLENVSAKPSKKWLKEADALVDSIGSDSFRIRLLKWFPKVKENRSAPYEEYEDDFYVRDSSYIISENNTCLLKGLVWISSRYADADMSRELRELAKNMYKKVYGVGMRNAKLANASLYSLSVMPGNYGLKEIVVLRAATKYNPALVNINRVFNKLAEDLGKTPEELASISVPDYGLTCVGEYRQMVGDCEAQARIVSVGKCSLVWVCGDKIQKSVPASVKTEYADDIKAIKALIKDVEVGCSAHSQRIEQMYLSKQVLDHATWTEQYIDHRLIGFLARKLVWRMTAAGSYTDIIWRADGFVAHDGKPVQVGAGAEFELWHPTMSSVEDVLAWRKYLIENEITQPFKQAHREIYLLTDAEEATGDHSLRFANHILKQAQFHALASQRGWKQTRGGSWDGGDENSAWKSIPSFGLTVELNAIGAEMYGQSVYGVYECVATAELAFYKKKRVNLKQVDPLVLSEIMRDVDLFVGVASIGNDPDWRDRNDLYWLDSGFGDLSELSKTRKQVLADLIQKLVIADKLRLDGRFLIVTGQLRTYKIHLGSGNILMEPNDSYLCIVEGKGGADVVLPFEGDHMLSLILSKAFMLANDKKISDSTITSQILAQ